MKKGIFISGTDTNVGKTVVSSLLLSALKSNGIPAGYFKPIQTGIDLDTLTVSELSGIPLTSLPTPIYSFPEPTAPSRAAQIHKTQIQIESVLEGWHRLDSKYWIVEGAGGLLVPLNSQCTIRELVKALSQKLILVASTRLGTINHTLMSLEVARVSGIEVMGIVLVGEEDPGLDVYLAEFAKIPVIAWVPPMGALSCSRIQEMAPLCFPPKILHKIYE